MFERVAKRVITKIIDLHSIKNCHVRKTVNNSNRLRIMSSYFQKHLISMLKN